MHLTNIDPGVADQIYKLFSMILCANTLGQVPDGAGAMVFGSRGLVNCTGALGRTALLGEALMASILNPPVLGDASFERFAEDSSRGSFWSKQKYGTKGTLKH